MKCKFLDHGISISYDQVVKPCCVYKPNDSWKTLNHVTFTDLKSWNISPAVSTERDLLDKDIWPVGCQYCSKHESLNRKDSIRGNGNASYAHYNNDDITLEIRPGNTCNFACQTCWPDASSRVAQYHLQAGLIGLESVNTQRLTDFTFLDTIAPRIKDVVVLGGEPFYDKSCKKFIAWAKENLNARLIMFTNGSCIDFEFLKQYQGKITIVFSIDAVGQAAEYIRVGTVWDEVLDNYTKVKELPNVETRVNITTSIYNFSQIEHLINWLSKDWPAVVSFGRPSELYFSELAVPPSARNDIILSLEAALKTLVYSNIKLDQKQNAVGAIKSIINNLKNNDYDHSAFMQWSKFVDSMDQVKGLKIEDYCPDLASMLNKVSA